MRGNGSHSMYAYEILVTQSVKFLGGAGVISGEIFRIFGRNFNESMCGELHNVVSVRFYMR